MHFIRTLYNGEDLTHDFSVDAFELQPTLSSATSLHANNQEGKPVFMKRNLSASDFIIEVSGRKYLQFSDYLRVAYKNERPERMYSHRYNSHDRDQVSQIRSDAPRIEIFANGNYADSNALILFGYMGWEKLADMVPLTYIPVED